MNRAVVTLALLAVSATASAGTVADADPSDQPPGQVAVVPAPAAIPTPPAPLPPPPPQNEDWSNVSHINGTPVKVGERGDYLYAYKKVNISVDPLAALFGYYDGSVSLALSQHLAVSASAAYWKLPGGSDSGYQATASLPIYLRRVFSGPFLEPGLIARSTSSPDGVSCDASSSCSSTMSSSAWMGVEMMFGWQWMFDDGLNLSVAFGVARHLTDSSDQSTDANGYFRFGYAF